MLPNECKEKTAPDEIGAELLNETDESQKDEDESGDEDDLAKYKDEQTGEVPHSFFEVLCRECSKIPYTPEEQQVIFVKYSAVTLISKLLLSIRSLVVQPRFRLDAIVNTC